MSHLINQLILTSYLAFAIGLVFPVLLEDVGIQPICQEKHHLDRTKASLML
jgi:hypothetical protein